MPSNVVLISEHPAPDTVRQALHAQDFNLHTETSDLGTASPLAFVLDADMGRLEFVLAQYHQWLTEPYLRTVPVYIVTANDSAARQAALDAGATGLLTAPLDSVELLHQLNRLAANKPPMFRLEELGDFNVLGHDLKSPLGTVISSLELLRELTQDEPMLHSLVENSVVAAHRQNMLIENMVDYMRVQSGEIEYEIVSASVPEVLNKFAARIPDEKTRKWIPVSIEANEPLPNVQADAHLLLRVLVALLDNALKFCTKESELVLKTHLENDFLFIDMMDTGRAIMPGYVNEIFEPEHQFTARLAGSRTSVALNLPFARAVIRLMGGDISVSEQEKWTVFSIKLLCVDKEPSP